MQDVIRKSTPKKTVQIYRAPRHTEEAPEASPSWWTRRRTLWFSGMGVLLVLVAMLVAWWGHSAAAQYLGEGNRALASKRYTEALKNYNAVEDLGFFHHAAASSALIARGDIERMKNDIDAAERDYRKALQKKKTDAGRRALAAVLLQQSKTDEIEALMQKINPKNAGDELLLARTALRKQSLGEASQHIDEALHIDPENVEAKELSSLMLLSSSPRDAEQALASLSSWKEVYRATKQWNDHPESPSRELQVATMLLQASEPDLAYALTVNILQEQTNYREAQRVQAESLFVVKKYADAERVADGALEASPLNGPLQFLLARILFAEGKKDEALLAFDRAGEMGEASALYHAIYADALFDAHDRERGFQQLTMAYEKDPQDFAIATELFWQQFDADTDVKRTAEQIQKNFPNSDFGFAAEALVATSSAKQQTLLAEARKRSLSSAFASYVEALAQEDHDINTARQLFVKAIDEDFSGEIGKRAEARLRSID